MEQYQSQNSDERPQSLHILEAAVQNELDLEQHKWQTGIRTAAGNNGAFGMREVIIARHSRSAHSLQQPLPRVGQGAS